MRDIHLSIARQAWCLGRSFPNSSLVPTLSAVPHGLYSTIPSFFSLCVFFWGEGGGLKFWKTSKCKCWRRSMGPY